MSNVCMGCIARSDRKLACWLDHRMGLDAHVLAPSERQRALALYSGLAAAAGDIRRHRPMMMHTANDARFSYLKSALKRVGNAIRFHPMLLEH
jgi:hypothetical protein